MTITVCSQAQQSKATKAQKTDTNKFVSLTAKFDENKMIRKDGYLIDEYIVNISFDQAKMLDGKQIKVTGTYTIVKGLENEPREFDKDGNIIYKQGRLNDTKYINSPTIEIIEK